MTLHPANSKSYQLIFIFIFFGRCTVHFWSGTENLVKIKLLVFYNPEKRKGRAKSAPPPSRAQVISQWEKNQIPSIRIRSGDFIIN